MTKLRHITAMLAVVTLSSSSIVKTPNSDGKNFELLILHNNDMHARFEQTSQLSGACSIADRDAGKCYGGFPRVAHLVKEARKAAASGEGPPVLYLNAGDTYTGTAWFTIYKWKIAAEFLNALQPDAVSLGNHEFDNGVSGLTPFIRNLTCPTLAANLILTNEPELESQSNLMKSVAFNISGTKVGVIGYLTPETKILATKNNVEYIEEVIAIQEEVNKLKNDGIQILIALGHSGFLKDLEIAKKVDGLDLVIGGHTNTFLWNGTTPDSENIQGPYPTVVQQTSGRLVPVVQAYAYTKYLGKLNLIFDSNGELISYDGNPILLDNSIPQDPAVLEIVYKYHQDVLKISDVVVGSSSVVLDGLSCRLQECNLGNLITDAIVDKYATEYTGDGWSDAPIAIMQGGGIRASVSHVGQRFNITKGDLFTVMPFDGRIVKVAVSGLNVQRMLEHSVADYNTIRAPGQFLQMSGMKVAYDFKRPPGKRVTKVLMMCGKCEIPMYAPLNVREVYNILMNDFLSMGGDGFSVFNGLASTVLNYDEMQCTVDYISKMTPVHPAVEGRVIINNNEQKSNSAAQKSISGFCLGNHEFDEEIDGVVPFIRNLTSPVLAANLILTQVPELEKEENLYKSIVLTKNNVRIGIVGYLTPDTKFLAPKNNVEYEEEVVALKKEVNKLKQMGITIIIALGHSGFLTDLLVAEEVEDLDLVIGGHSNTFLTNNSTDEIPEYPQGPYPTVVTQKSGRRVLVVQAYAYTKYMGKLHLIFNDQGEIIYYDGEPVLLNKEIPEDPELLDMVNRYRIDVDKVFKKVVGTSLSFLDGDSCRLKECNFGNFITDAILNYTKQYHNKYSDVNIAVIQGGRIRTSISGAEKPFKITRSDLIAVIPFSDTLCLLNMNGTVLRKALEHSVTGWRRIDTPGQFLQMSGMQVVYDLAKEHGSRVVKAKAICSGCSELNDIEDNVEYKVLTCNFLCDGGDGYQMFEPLQKEIVPYDEITCAIDYLNKYSPIKPTYSNRISILNADNIQPARFLPSKAQSVTFSIKMIFVFCSILLFT